MTVGEIIRRERLKQNLSLRQLAKKADVSLATLVNTETNKHEPTSSTLRSIAEALGLKSSDIMLESVGSIVQANDLLRKGDPYGGLR